MQPKQNLLCDLEKLIEYSDSAVNTVSFNPCVRPFPRIKMSFFIISIHRGSDINSKNNDIFTYATVR